MWKAVFTKALDWNETTQFLSSGPKASLLLGSTWQNFSSQRVLPYLLPRGEKALGASAFPKQQEKPLSQSQVFYAKCNKNPEEMDTKK